MTKLITAWALAAVLSAVLAYKFMTPKQAPPAAKTQFSLASVQIAIENQFETVDHLLAEELVSMDKASVLLFDTRPMAEYKNAGVLLLCRAPLLWRCHASGRAASKGGCHI